MKKRHHSSKHEAMDRRGDYKHNVDAEYHIERDMEKMHDMGMAEPKGPMKYAHAGMDPRRYQAAESRVLIKEDHNAPANLPQNYEIKYWPREGQYTPEVLNDGPDGIDRQIDMDDSMKMKLFKPRKY